MERDSVVDISLSAGIAFRSFKNGMTVDERPIQRTLVYRLRNGKKAPLHAQPAEVYAWARKTVYDWLSWCIALAGWVLSVVVDVGSSRKR